jgi:hypothetical protein
VGEYRDRYELDSLQAVKSLAAVAAQAGLTYAAIKKLGVDSIVAWAQQEQAAAKLDQALRVTHQYTADASDRMNAFASELQRVALVEDDVVLAIQRQLVAMGLSVDRTLEVTRARQQRLSPRR